VVGLILGWIMHALKGKNFEMEKVCPPCAYKMGTSVSKPHFLPVAKCRWLVFFTAMWLAIIFALDDEGFLEGR